MNSKIVTRVWLAWLVILPVPVIAQETSQTYNAPPNGVLKSAVSPRDPQSEAAKSAEVKAPRAAAGVVQKPAVTAAPKTVIDPKKPANPTISSLSKSAAEKRPTRSNQDHAATAKRTVPAKTATSGIARINTERVNIRMGPGEEFARLTLLDKETRVNVNGSQGEWVQISIQDGRSGWLRRKFIDLPFNIQPANVAVKTAVPANPAPIVTAKAVVPQAPPANKIETKAATGTVAPKVSPATVKAADSSSSNSLLAGTKPDPIERTQESPAEAMRDGWKLMLYLVPMLALIVLAIRGLKAIQQKTGWLPGVKRGLMGSVNLTNARKTGGSSIRVMESVPLGTVGLHLVEVKGRVLLLGTSGASISVLTEVKDGESLNGSEFKAILDAAAVDLGGHETETAGLSSLVGNLDDSLREARELINQKAAAVRHWSEM